MNFTKWYVCEYMGNGKWRTISLGYDYFTAKKVCHELFEERYGNNPNLPSISVIDDTYPDLEYTGIISELRG